MSFRIHTADVSNIRVAGLHRSEFAKQLIDTGLLDTVADLPQEAAIVVEDPGNGEALLVLGSRSDLIGLARRIEGQAMLIPEFDPSSVEGKVRNLLEKYPLQDPGACTEDDYLADGQYLLIEESNKGFGHWFSRHDSPEDAAVYHDNQEYDDWDPILLVDLHTGEELVPETKTTFK